MSLVFGRLETLAIARAATSARSHSEEDIAAALRRFAPADLSISAWRDLVLSTVHGLRGSGILDDRGRPRADELARRIGKHTTRTWSQLADRVLPALALGIHPDDTRHRSVLAGRDAWIGAIAARALGVWTAGPPPLLAATCDALAWRELGLAGSPKRCPPEIRAHFLHRALHCEPGPPLRLLIAYVARELEAPRDDVRTLRDALVGRWLTGRQLGPRLGGSTIPPPFAVEPVRARGRAS